MGTLLSVAAVAAEIGIAYQTAYRWIVTKDAVPSEIVGKNTHAVRREDFEKFAADYKAGRYDRWPK
jgi:hypothetical protein